MKVLTINGSLQATSSNRALLELAVAVAPSGTQVGMSISVGALPHFNPDIDAASVDAVTTLISQVRAADAVIVATPEYAHSLPGTLKNALDWMVGNGAMYERPVAIISAAVAPTRGALGRGALEQTLRGHGSIIVTSVTISTTAAPSTIEQALGEVFAALSAAVRRRQDEALRPNSV
jgi:chromate reductase, NAD(P)H dehydrogenase (quinone)